MSNIPEHCPGVENELAGKVTACEGCPNQKICSSSSEIQKRSDSDIELIKRKLNNVKHIILVISGKGGVGKSTFACLLARSFALMNDNLNVAVLDLDICGPSVPRMMGVLNEKVHQSGSGWSPVFVDDNLCVMSIGFLLSNSNDAVIWRGPKKNGLIRQFFTEVDWNENIEYLVIDTPPGTSDEHLSVVQFLKDIPNLSAVVLTTPQEISLLDVRKEIDFLRKVNVPIAGVVENMSLFICSKCKNSTEIFPSDSGGALKMSKEFDIPFLGQLPLDPLIAKSCDQGLNPIEDHPELSSVKAFISIVSNLTNNLKNQKHNI